MAAGLFCAHVALFPAPLAPGFTLAQKMLVLHP